MGLSVRARMYILICAMGLVAVPAHADGLALDSGDTAWILMSTALVMLMTPGLGLFYGGMVRRKNVLGTILQSFFMIGLIGVHWVVIGYTLSFGPDKLGLIGGLDAIGLRGVSMHPNPEFAETIPHYAFVMFQGMFAIITVALITGAFAERMKFRSYVIFSLLWVTVIYAPVCHWVWGPGGWIDGIGALDFAGGTVVHIASGIAALACALVIGCRKGYGKEDMKPHNLTMTIIGTAMLWFGWFGFNAGSALAADGLAASALLVTNTSAAAGVLAWMLVESWHRGKPTALGGASGAVAGLVGITPAAGFVGPMAAIAIGAGAGFFCYLAVAIVKMRLGYDDSLDVFGIHGIGGAWGALATGLFATKLVNPDGADGLFYGNFGLVWIQLVAILAVAAYSFVLTVVLLKITGLVSGLRVSNEEEESGLDITQHGEIGYDYLAH